MLDDGKDTLIDLCCRIIGISIIGNELMGYVLSLALIATLLIFERNKRRRQHGNA